MVELKAGTKPLLHIAVIVILISEAFITGCTKPPEPEPAPTREEAIPGDAVKVTPEMDVFPPVFHSGEWEEPGPMEGAINTAGAEDSPFIIPEGNSFFFFFTPDVDVPPNEQLLDGVTGIWWSKKVAGTWTEPERIILNDDVSLDGAPFVPGDTLWFASARAGNYGEIDFYTATFKGGRWTDVENAGKQLNQDYDVGELHITLDGKTMYCGRQGENRDIWVLEKRDGGWSEPLKVQGINSDLNEDQPFITPDGSELWFTGDSRLGYPGPAVFRSVKTGSGWSEPEEIISNWTLANFALNADSRRFSQIIFKNLQNLRAKPAKICVPF